MKFVLNYFKSLRFSQSYLFLYFIACSIPILIWSLLDRRIWPWDQAWYGEESLNLYIQITSSPPTYLNSILNLFGAKAPAIALLGQFAAPLSYILPTPESALLVGLWMSGVLSLWAFNKSLNNLLITEKNYLYAPAACIGLLSSPMFIGLHQHFFVEAYQLLAVCITIYIYSTIKTRSLLTNLILLGAVVCFGLLVKITTPFYQLPFLFASVVSIWRHNQDLPKSLSLKVLGFSLPIYYITLSWYHKNFVSILTFAKNAAGKEIGSLYSSHNLFSDKIIFWIKHFFENITSLPSSSLVGLILLIIIIWTYLNIRSKIFNKSIVRPYFYLLLILFVFFSLCFFASQQNEETRYLLPLLPTFILGFFGLLQSYKISPKVVLVFSLLALINNYLIVFGVFPKHIKNPWLKPIETNSESYENLMNLTLKICKTSSINLVGLDLPNLNNHTLQFTWSKISLLANRLAPQCHFYPLGWAESKMDPVIERIRSVGPTAFISFPNDSFAKLESDPFNKVSQDAKLYMLRAFNTLSVEKHPPYEIIYLGRAKE